MDDYSQVVQGEGVGEVGDDDEDGGGQEGGQHAAHQGAGSRPSCSGRSDPWTRTLHAVAL